MNPAVTIARLFLLTVLVPATLAFATEEPQYRVVRQDGRFEIREYAPHLVAETIVSGDQESASDTGFGRLFDYITGANRRQQDIAMTSPVLRTRADGESIAMTVPVTDTRRDDKVVVAFLVPSQYTADTVPQPTNPDVRIRAVPARRVAAVRFNGYWTDSAFAAEEKSLRDFLKKEQLAPAGPAELARYDAPFVPPGERRNEILVPLGPETARP
jgi:hypothetical protein